MQISSYHPLVKNRQMRILLSRSIVTAEEVSEKANGDTIENLQKTRACVPRLNTLPWHMPRPMPKPPEGRRVRLFRNGRNQSVRIPREFELPGEEAVIRKEGSKLIIEAARPKSLLELLASWEPLDEEFPHIDDPPPEPVDL